MVYLKSKKFNNEKFLSVLKIKQKDSFFKLKNN